MSAAAPFTSWLATRIPKRLLATAAPKPDPSTASPVPASVTSAAPTGTVTRLLGGTAYSFTSGVVCPSTKTVTRARPAVADAFAIST